MSTSLKNRLCCPLENRISSTKCTKHVTFFQNHRHNHKHCLHQVI
uniref:Uncharacterized protein n=1 Tax=Anguilla anguilla TaxID=7936 RepID=A0A0E9XKG3_ANGAN